ncbi:MAG: hypothetical protein ABEI32_16600 [Halothece sp.]
MTEVECILNPVWNNLSGIAGLGSATFLFLTLLKQQEDTKIKIISESLNKYENIIANLAIIEDRAETPKKSVTTVDNEVPPREVTGKRALRTILDINRRKQLHYSQIREDNSILINQIIGNLYSSLLYILELNGKTRERYLTIFKNLLSFEEQVLIFLEIYYKEKQKKEENYDFGDLVRKYGLINIGTFKSSCILSYFNENIQDFDYTDYFFQIRHNK